MASKIIDVATVADNLWKIHLPAPTPQFLNEERAATEFKQAQLIAK